ncbi:MAG: YbaB/EbfC family nucleoid-associated protein [Patescibacteria group bacterium]|nr:YbaB/EbfC family nucleoid-associated protein [Patescibacteria group bacterium]MDP4031227.1 YbaB/EbfC family nucleoid-associated protein [Candidatus Beckwithbacteria bacterium]MDZ4229043.1 YbaB/EbfC family nucleoid-associated protein [Patescibacteria group bacterium]
MFDKVKQLANLKKMRDQAMAIQKQLAQEEIELSEDNIRILISGDQKIKLLEIDGLTNERVVEMINKAIKKSQEVAARKLAEMSGGLSGILKGQGPLGG